MTDQGTDMASQGPSSAADAATPKSAAVWRPVASAPRNYRAVELQLASGYELTARFNPDGYENERGVCGGWEAVDESRHPPCWSDGVCWSSNESGVPSDQPMFWRPAIRPTPSSAEQTAEGELK